LFRDSVEFLDSAARYLAAHAVACLKTAESERSSAITSCQSGP
jgi:hypothetical protein